MIDPTVVESIRTKYRRLNGVLDERSRRLWGATEAAALGYGGIQAVATATGLGRRTLWEGLRELDLPAAADILARTGRSRRPGGGRKKTSERDPQVLEALKALVAESTAGDPMSPLKWTCKSTRLLADELTAAGHSISHKTVAGLLYDLGYTLQANEKKREGRTHPDRDAQFRYINGQCKRFVKRGQPVVSVDTKKKELVGDFKNNGQEWRKKGKPTPVRVHDFKDEELGKVNPYGVYDIKANNGWVSVGTDHDTAEFAAESVYQWWRHMGRRANPAATQLLITADGGGSNGSRNRLWRLSLQRLANRTGLAVTVCHFPPGTSKWNKIEHRMFSHISMNWRGRPLTSHEVIVNLIAGTKTRTGLRIKAGIDSRTYVTGRKVSDQELATVSIKTARFHGDWNYTISPTTG
jgi:hypothetical protein